MKIVTQDTASELAVMLLQNDKKIRDELVENTSALRTQLEENFETKITEVDNKMVELDKKIEESISPLSNDAIDQIFKNKI